MYVAFFYVHFIRQNNMDSGSTGYSEILKKHFYVFFILLVGRWPMADDRFIRKAA